MNLKFTVAIFSLYGIILYSAAQTPTPFLVAVECTNKAVINSSNKAPISSSHEVSISPFSHEVGFAPSPEETPLPPLPQEISISPCADELTFSPSPYSSPTYSVSVVSPSPDHEANVSPSAVEATISPSPQQVFISTPSPVEATISPSSGETIIYPSPYEGPISPSQEVAIVPSPGQSGIAPSPYDHLISPPPYEVTISPPPQETTIAPSPGQVGIAPSPYDHLISPSPSQATISPPPHQATIVPSPAQSRIAPSQYVHVISPFPSGGKIFNVLSYGAIGDGRRDDTKSFRDTWEAVCSVQGSPVLLVPSGREFLLNTVVFQGPCKSTDIRFEVHGTIVGASYLRTWNCKDDGNKDWIEFRNVEGLSIVGDGMINGHGKIWWDMKYKKMKDICEDAPTAIVVKGCTKIHISGLNFVDNPRVHLVIERSTEVVISNLFIRAPGDSPNTDGIHIQASQDVSIHDSFIGTGDDCISIGSGSSNINISTIACGPGHGISIGSLGSGGSEAKVENIYVGNVLLARTTNGVRIKTWQGGKGYARNIVFENIYLNFVDRPIIIDQYYCNGEHNCINHTSAVKVSNITYNGVSGTSSRKLVVNLACSKTVACSNLYLNNVNIFWAENRQKMESYCINAEGSVGGRVVPAVSCLKHS